LPTLNGSRDARIPTHRVMRAAAGLSALLCLTAPGFAGAQKIVKWVDAQGQTHYSDHAPSGQEAAPVSLHLPPRTSAPAVPVTTSRTTAVARFTDGAAKAARDIGGAREAEEERRQAERREAESDAKVQADKDLVARCNQAREDYCDQGADTIRQRDATRSDIQYGNAISARQERISRGQAPGVLPPPPQ